MTAWHGGKGPDRRKEDTQKVEKNLEQVKWNRDKSKDKFVKRVNGKVVEE